MYILDVIPLSRSLGTDTLSYFSAKKADTGSLVSVPLRSSNIQGIVVAVHNMADLKSELKNQDFSLRNVHTLHGSFLYTPTFIESLTHLKNYYAMSLGSLLNMMTPKSYIDLYADSGFYAHYEHIESDVSAEVTILQGDAKERIAYYKRHIRTCFARKQSVFIMCPTQQSVEHLTESLSSGAPHRICSLHAKKTKKYLKETYEKIRTHTETLVIIGTPQFIALAPLDTGLFITEEEGSRHYISQQRPMIDYRLVLRAYAARCQVMHILADHVLRFETLATAFQEDWHFIAPPVFHTPKNIPPRIIDMTEEADQDRKSFRIFDPSVERNMALQLDRDEVIYIYVARKGLAPLTVCQDCGEVLCAPDSQNPLVLYERDTEHGSESYYYDQRTRTKYRAIDACPSCNSWKLKMLGVGVDTVVKHMKKLFPDEAMLTIDSHKNMTPKKFKDAHTAWKAKNGKIVIATEQLFNYIDEPCDHMYIASIDTLMSLPHYTLQEELLRRLLQTMELTRTTWTLQTRLPHHRVFHAFRTRHFRELYEEDLAERKAFLYPPEYLIISIERQCKHASIQNTYALIREILNDENVRMEVRPGLKKNHYTVRGSLRILKNDWISPFSSEYPPMIYIAIMRRMRGIDQSYYLRINP